MGVYEGSSTNNEVGYVRYGEKRPLVQRARQHFRLVDGLDGRGRAREGGRRRISSLNVATAATATAMAGAEARAGAGVLQCAGWRL